MRRTKLKEGIELDETIIINKIQNKNDTSRVEPTFSCIFWSWASSRTSIPRLFWRSIMLNIYCLYGLLISLKQNFISLYEYLYRDFSRALFTNSMIEHLSVFEKVDVDCNRILLPQTLHISNFRELSILHLDLIVFFLNWSTGSHVYFRFYL